MTTREMLVIVLAVQMSFGQVAFAQGAPPPPSDDPNAGLTGAPPPPPGSNSTATSGNPIPKKAKPIGETRSLPHLDCRREIKCSPFLKQFKKDTVAMSMIYKQLAKNPGQGCDALRNHAFLEHMMKRYDDDIKTEANTYGLCVQCAENFRHMIDQTSEDGGKADARAIFDFTECQQASVPVQPAQPAPAIPAQPESPAVPQQPPADVGRESSYGERRHHREVADDGPTPQSSSGLSNSNLMWGLVGGIFGYMLGKNSAQQQQYYQQPYWQQLGPRPPPFGQVPGGFGSPFMGRPGLPSVYPVGQSGFGAPNFLPYGGGGALGQPGYMGGVGGYGLGGTTGFNNFGGYSTPIYNGVTPPAILPYH